MRHAMSVVMRQFFEILSNIYDLSNMFESCQLGSDVFVGHGAMHFRPRGLRTHPCRTRRTKSIRTVCEFRAFVTIGRICCIELRRVHIHLYKPFARKLWLTVYRAPTRGISGHINQVIYGFPILDSDEPPSEPR